MLTRKRRSGVKWVKDAISVRSENHGEAGVNAQST